MCKVIAAFFLLLVLLGGLPRAVFGLRVSKIDSWLFQTMRLFLTVVCHQALV